MKKVVGISILILALGIGIVPQFTDCLSQGKALTTTTGMVVPMKCHWSAIAAMILSIPLGVVGLLMAFGKRKENLRSLSLMGAVLGALVVATPTVLIGVCANPAHICNEFMLPFLILTGGIVGVASLGMLFVNRKAEELPA